jgi:hypothetical protein
MARVYIRGIDEPLPEGENLLWQGRPDTRALMRHVFRLRLWVGYFAALAVFSFILSPASGVARVIWMGLLGGVFIGGVWAYARATATTSIYAITDQRVVMRIGVAFPAVFNLPYSRVAGAAAREFHDGTGDIAFEIGNSDRIGFVYLWPHVRPWRFRNPSPMMRGLVDVEEVSGVLRSALVAAGVQDGDRSRERAPVRISVLDDDGIEILASDRTPTASAS